MEYRAYEVLCCTERADDPASEVVHRLQTDFPHVTLRLFVADRVHGTNAKIDNLDKMYRAARHEILVISADDILVPRDYLQHLVADLETPNVGVVSCPYRGKSGGTAASAFEALGIASEVFSGGFVARWMEGIRFALGSTMAVRKERVAENGGFPARADYPADDYELGPRISAQGSRNRTLPMLPDQP